MYIDIYWILYLEESFNTIVVSHKVCHQISIAYSSWIRMVNYIAAQL